jgi:hypothetical protein
MATTLVPNALKEHPLRHATRDFAEALAGLARIEIGVLKPDPVMTGVPMVGFGGLWNLADLAGRREQIAPIQDEMTQLAEKWAAAKTDVEKQDVADLAQSWWAAAKDVLGENGEKALTFRRSLTRDWKALPGKVVDLPDDIEQDLQDLGDWLAGAAKKAAGIVGFVALGLGALWAFGGRRDD